MLSISGCAPFFWTNVVGLLSVAVYKMYDAYYLLPLHGEIPSLEHKVARQLC